MHDAVETTPRRADGVENAFQLAWNTDIARDDDRCVQLLRQRPHMRFGLGVQVRHRKIGTGGLQRLGTAIGDAALVGDADDEHALAGKIDDRFHQASLLDVRSAQASVAITCSSSVGMTKMPTLLSCASMRVALAEFALSSSVTPSHARRAHTAARIAG